MLTVHVARYVFKPYVAVLFTAILGLTDVPRGQGLPVLTLAAVLAVGTGRSLAEVLVRKA